GRIAARGRGRGGGGASAVPGCSWVGLRDPGIRQGDAQQGGDVLRLCAGALVLVHGDHERRRLCLWGCWRISTFMSETLDMSPLARAASRSLSRAAHTSHPSAGSGSVSNLRGRSTGG